MDRRLLKCHHCGRNGVITWDKHGMGGFCNYCHRRVNEGLIVSNELLKVSSVGLSFDELASTVHTLVRMERPR